MNIRIKEAQARVIELRRQLDKAQAKSTKAMIARGNLRAGSTRARVTTANANWARAAEHRDLIADRLRKAEDELMAAMAGVDL